jgi:hypothetical protein
VRRVAAAIGVLVALLVVAQLVLPSVAERRLRDELADRGSVRSVAVSSFPAVELLFERADRVEVRMGESRLGIGDLGDQLERTRGVGELDARVDLLRLGPLLLRDLRLGKADGQLTGEAALTREDLANALPVDIGLEPVESGDGQLVLEATVGPVTARARLSARDGALVIAPDGLLGGFATLTVFEDPRVVVTGVGARPRPDGFTVTAEGHLA